MMRSFNRKKRFRYSLKCTNAKTKCGYHFKSKNASLCPECGAKGPRFWYDNYKINFLKDCK